MKLQTCLALAIAVGSANGVGAAPLEGDARAAIVKIYTIGQAADYEEAWNPGTFFSSTGSGCVILGNRILTAAHRVSHARFIEVRRHGRAERHELCLSK